MANKMNRDYYQRHWESNRYISYAEPKIKAAKYFHQMLNIDYNNKKILDAGCGEGVHLYWLANNYPKSQLYGIDISDAALLKIKNILPNVSLVCSDINILPFKDKTFDVTFCYGVFPHIRYIENAFKELCRVTKVGGYIGIWVYPGPSNFLFRSVWNILRKLSIYRPFANLLAHIIVPFLYILPTATKINLSNASWTQCKEIVLENLAPTILFHKEEDIINLFLKNNIEILHNSPSNKITIWGRKLA